MKIRCLLILATFLLSTVCYAMDSDSADAISDCVEKLSDRLDDKKWSIASSENTIVIESKFELNGYLIAPHQAEKPTKVKHRIELRFDSELQKEEFVQLAQARLQSLAVLRYGSETKAEYSNARKFLVNNPLPKYMAEGRLGQKYSIYFVSTESGFRWIGPLDLYKEVRAAEALIDHALGKLAE